MPADDAVSLLGELEAEQLRLRRLLRDRDPVNLAVRRASTEWSVTENVRHLLFAEQRHFGRFLPGKTAWSPLGLPPHSMARQRELDGVDGAVLADVREVLAEWDRAHREVRPYLERDTEAVRDALARNLRHLRAHAGVIERLLLHGGEKPISEERA